MKPAEDPSLTATFSAAALAAFGPVCLIASSSVLRFLPCPQTQMLSQRSAPEHRDVEEQPALRRDREPKEILSRKETPISWAS